MPCTLYPPTIEKGTVHKPHGQRVDCHSRLEDGLQDFQRTGCHCYPWSWNWRTLVLPRLAEDVVTFPCLNLNDMYWAKTGLVPVPLIWRKDILQCVVKDIAATMLPVYRVVRVVSVAGIHEDSQSAQACVEFNCVFGFCRSVERNSDLIRSAHV